VIHGLHHEIFLSDPRRVPPSACEPFCGIGQAEAVALILII